MNFEFEFIRRENFDISRNLTFVSRVSKKKDFHHIVIKA